MVSNDRSFSAPVASRKPSRRVVTPISSGRACCASVAIQCRKRAKAAASRSCALRAPAISTGFFAARGRSVGSWARTTVAPARSSAATYQAEVCEGSSRTRCPFRSPSAGAMPAAGSRVTWLPSHSRSSGEVLAGSRKTRAVPSLRTRVWPSGRGERMTSPPRTLNSHASDEGAVSTAASAPAAAIVAPIRARLSALSSPDRAAGWGTTASCGCAGRSSPQARSIGLPSTARSSAPDLATAAPRWPNASGLCRRGS